MPRADRVNPPSKGDEADRVGGLKRRDDVAVFHFTPTEHVAQGRRENTQNLPVHVVDRRRRKEQRTDRPAKVAKALEPRFNRSDRGLHGSASTACTAAFIQPHA